MDIEVKQIRNQTADVGALEQAAAVTPADPKGDSKTFSQDDVNRIVQDRLAKERSKTSDDLSRREQELAAREFRLNSRQRLLDRGYPEALLEALNCSDEETFNKSLEILEGFLKERGATPEMMELQKNAARFFPKFTGPTMGKGSQMAPDRIREAMKL